MENLALKTIILKIVKWIENYFKQNIDFIESDEIKLKTNLKNEFEENTNYVVAIKTKYFFESDLEKMTISLEHNLNHWLLIERKLPFLSYVNVKERDYANNVWKITLYYLELKDTYKNIEENNLIPFKD